MEYELDSNHDHNIRSNNFDIFIWWIM